MYRGIGANVGMAFNDEAAAIDARFDCADEILQLMVRAIAGADNRFVTFLKGICATRGV